MAADRVVRSGTFDVEEAMPVTPTATPCGLSTDPLTANIQEAAQLRTEGALPSPWQPHWPTTRRQVLDWLASPRTNWMPS
jgi:hypothetical protein